MASLRKDFIACSSSGEDNFELKYIYSMNDK